MQKKLLAALAIVAGAVFVFWNTRSEPTPAAPRAPCENPVKTEIREVRGTSLTGLVEPGEDVKLLVNFYDCNPILRGDIVAYQYRGNPNPIIKVVYGLPGDRFELRPLNGGWNVAVNGGILKNSEGVPFLLGGGEYRILSLYEHDYDGLLPGGAYLILGNLPAGSLDSSRFGFVSKNDIIGKVIQ